MNCIILTCIHFPFQFRIIAFVFVCILSSLVAIVFVAVKCRITKFLIVGWKK